MLPTSKKTSLSVAHEIRLGVEDLESEVVTPSHAELKETSSAMYHFSRSSSTKKMLSDIEFERKKNKFVERMSKILDALRSLKMEQELLESVFTMVLQSAEDYLWCEDVAKCQAVKEECVVCLLKSFTKDDEQLCRQMVSFLKYKIKPSTMYRRNKRTIVRFGKFFLGMLFKAV